MEELCQQMIDEGKKVNRAGTLLAKVKDKRFALTEKLLHKIFDERIELEHETSIYSIIDFLLNHPEVEAWSIK